MSTPWGADLECYF
uniref:Macaca fascicularis brain cDNA clone: QflA-20994, similar to human F-box only protein 7 (FBXO7), mRNA, RefSeq: NM_012179.2 n=1 Tax=Macaca fascicularis TaxID=9541 RepID=I7GNH0_MACFA|nr:unnamed protein product [Macaca fascicularis]